MGYFEDLTKVFDVALMDFGTANSIKIALENIDAPTSTSAPYLASYMLLADTLQADLGYSEERAGVYQVDINYGSTLGSAPINKMADKLNALFKAGYHLPVTTSAPKCNLLAWAADCAKRVG